MSNFVGAIVSIICLGIANFGYEAFQQVPSYGNAMLATWHQIWAIMIYYFIWVRE